MIHQPNPESVLKKVWGHTSFRPLQRNIIDHVISGNDAIALLPTGGGKSICYQVPALCREGLCLVISPLISLITEQVEFLNDKGIKALAIHSFMRFKEIDQAMDNAVYGNYKFLYVSPERLQTEMFQERFRKMKISMIAVDEAHCISQWGYDFRPAYLEISKLRTLQPETGFIALTATATTKVVEDISSNLQLNNPKIFRKSFRRENISFNVLHKENKNEILINALKKLDSCAIVYVRNRRKCKEFSELLTHHGLDSYYYHAGLPHASRLEKQEKWMNSKMGIMVSTNAFGMGIDKADVGLVAHFDLPDSLEAFYQEAGRAGRDNRPARSLLVYANYDVDKLWSSYENAYPDVKSLRNHYVKLCNHLQIALGEGKNRSFLFDFDVFCAKYKLDKAPSYQVLKQLEKENYLTLSDGFVQPSSLQITTQKNDLRTFIDENPSYKNTLNFLLRAYSGIMEQGCKINEREISKKLKLSLEEVDKKLGYLEKTGIISYSKQTDQPVITFMQERIKSNDLHLSKQYTKRKSAQLHRIQSMLEFVRSHDQCRMNIILKYFDEESQVDCGKCDRCQKNFGDVDEKVLTKKLLHLFDKKKGLDSTILTEKLSEYDESTIDRICRNLLAKEVIMLREGKYYAKDV